MFIILSNYILLVLRGPYMCGSGIAVLRLITILVNASDSIHRLIIHLNPTIYIIHSYYHIILYSLIISGSNFQPFYCSMQIFRNLLFELVS